MTLETVVSLISAIAYALLMYQQNRILREQNRIMLEERGGEMAGNTGHYTRYWPLLVMALLTLLTWAAIATKAYRKPDVKQWYSTKQETIYGQSYINQTLEIDGKSFDHCHFTNVNFIFHGLAPTDFKEVTMQGDIQFKTDNVAAKGYARLIKAFPNAIPDWRGEDVHGNQRLLDTTKP
jgi:hypothetical protein